MANERVLIVEDENVVAKDIKVGLESLGYAVSGIVSRGDKAIEKTRETHPDLVLMDIKLKGDIDGVKAAKQIRLRYDVPVVYLTAYADDKTLERAKITEPFGYIIKPFEERELRTAIEIALHKHKMENKSRKNKQLLATTLKSMGNAVIAMDAKGFIAFMNPFAETLTGWRQEDALGRDLTEVFNTMDEETGTFTEGSLTKVLREGVIVDGANILIAKNGKEISVLHSAAPIRDDRGNTAGVVLVFQDITQYKRAEERLRASVKKYRLIAESAKVRKRTMPVFLTKEEIRKLRIQPKREETHYLRELEKRRRQGLKWLKRIENKVFNARRNNAIIALFYSSGIRLAELVNLDLVDIDLKKKQVKVVGKGGSKSYCFITREAARSLKAYAEARKNRGNAQDQALFITRTGERIKGRDVQRMVSEYAKEAGIKKKVSPHTLRHSVALHLVDQGMALQDVQVFLRHTSTSYTHIYTHNVSNKRLKEKLSSHHPDNL